MEEIQGSEVETLIEENPTFTEAKAAIGKGKLAEAEKILINFLNSDPKPRSDLQLASYSQLIRIAAEVRNFEKIPGLVEKVKVIAIVSDSDKLEFARCLYMTGIGWWFAGNNDEAKKCFTQSLQLSEKLGSELSSFNKLMLAQLLRNDGKYNEALDIVIPLKEYAIEIKNDYLTAELNITHGDILRKQGMFHKAIESYEKGREILNQKKSSATFHYVLWAIGTCYAALEEHEKAQIYLNMTLNDDEGVEFWRINILSKMTLAEMYTVTGDYSKADALYKKIIEKIGPDEQSYYGRRALRGQTLLAIKKGEFETANEMIDKLVIIAVRDKKQKEIMRLRLLKAEVLLRTGEAPQHDEAIAMLQEAYAFFKQQGSSRHQAICLELLARLDSRSGFPTDSMRKIAEVTELTNDVSLERLHLRAELASLVLDRKLGRAMNTSKMDILLRTVLRLNAQAERMILARFTSNTYEDWAKELTSLDPHAQRFVNEFFEDFHFVNNQSMDLEIDKNSHYVREKHLGEIPFHNKFTLMRILLLLAESPGKEYSKEQLAREIWGQDYNPLRHDNNIYININRLRKLIEPNPRESRYVMNGAQGYYMNPAMKVNISTKISDVAPRLQSPKRPVEETV